MAFWEDLPQYELTLDQGVSGSNPDRATPKNALELLKMSIPGRFVFNARIADMAQ
ncbi:MAG: hypothetical protein ACE5G0_00035 [Rhodothermales bacterium]